MSVRIPSWLAEVVGPHNELMHEWRPPSSQVKSQEIAQIAADADSHSYTNLSYLSLTVSDYRRHETSRLVLAVYKGFLTAR